MGSKEAHRDNPLVTVGVVTCNRREELARALASTRAQTYRPIEIIIVDNNSTDGTREMIRAQWPDAELICLPRNIGCQPGRNIGMQRARGKYVFNLDDDGELAPDAIARIVERFEAEERLAVICARTVPPEARDDREPLTGNDAVPRYAANFRSGASAVRVSVLGRVGCFPEYPRGGAEYHLALRMLDAGHEILHLPQAVMYHPDERAAPIERVHSFYAAWHSLRTAFELLPWPECLADGLWKLSSLAAAAVAHGCLGAWLAGVCSFLLDLPGVRARRRPVRRDTLRKALYLTFHRVSDPAAIPEQAYSPWRTLWRRIKRTLRRRRR